jgi:penicillin-binding protein 1A
MAVAYAVFANGGYLIEPNILKEVRALSGELLFQANHPVVCRTCEEVPDPTLLASAAEPGALEASDVSPPVPAANEDPHRLIPAKRVLDAGNAFIVNSMLEDVVRRGTATKAKVLERGDLAGKTGTTNEADVWFNGYQRHLVASVWVGFSDHSKVGDNEFGSGTPLPIWIDFMRVALAGVPEEQPEQPEGVVTMKIDPRTGNAANPNQSDSVFEYFLAGHLPSEPANQLPDSPSGTETATVRSVDIF